ncbi:hypothetical protein [Devosia chinhatensis]|uniref:hypothetical protein n=1 Tax=Devosia chinhatensis TaxID=429727 RepID=UPI000A531375|nr:hypothetical protein [Devosia chinhatensis]
MIADFRYNVSPSNDQVIIRLFWKCGRRMGHILVPPDVGEAITRESIPEPGELPIFSALGYAVVLAGQNALQLSITGDRSVWDCSWGHLVETH